MIVLAKLTVLGRCTDLNFSRARPTVLAVGTGGGCLDFFLLQSFLFFLPLYGRQPILD